MMKGRGASCPVPTIRPKEKEEKIGKGKGLEAYNSTKEFVAST